MKAVSTYTDQVVEFARGNHTVGEASSFISLEIVRFGDTTNETQLTVVLQQLTATGTFRLDYSLYGCMEFRIRLQSVWLHGVLVSAPD